MSSRLFAPGLLDDRVALVSGGGSAVGRAIARELCECGATVIVCGSDRESLEQTAAGCAGGRCHALECDVVDEEQVEALVSRVLDDHTGIDLLVNGPGEQDDDFRGAVRINIEGTWLMTHAVATRAMIPRDRGGKVVNVVTRSSTARAGVENLTRVLSIEWARFDICLTAIAGAAPGAEDQLAWLTAYLASPAGDYFSGAILALDGAASRSPAGRG